ncbi:MAG: DUF1995 family protein [Cyanobacteria bacterium P01_D01_bin.73]
MTATATGVPNSLSEAIAQSGQATVAALDDGVTRLQVSLLLPGLKGETFAAQMISMLLATGRKVKVFFPDMGAAALAKRNWGEVPFEIMDVGSGRTPVGQRVTEEDELLLFVEPSAVEVLQVEELCNQAGDRPTIFLNPNLEDIATIGIGYAGRQLRERFLNQLQDVYYLSPDEGFVVSRTYPNQWQVWGEPQVEGEGYILLGERSQRPAGDVLDGILMGTAGEEGDDEAPAAAIPKRSILDQMQRFLQALSS